MPPPINLLKTVICSLFDDIYSHSDIQHHTPVPLCKTWFRIWIKRGHDAGIMVGVNYIEISTPNDVKQGSGPNTRARLTW